MVFELPRLPYAYHALEPYVDTETMHLHHTKHQQKYLDVLNAYIASVRQRSGAIPAWRCIRSRLTDRVLQDEGAYLEGLSAVQIVQAASEDHVRNNGGGYHNHSCVGPCLALMV